MKSVIRGSISLIMAAFIVIGCGTTGSGKGNTTPDANSDQQEVLVTFSYPFENPQFGTVKAEVFTGEVSSRITLLSINPSASSITIPMGAGYNQFSIMYTFGNNKNKYQFCYPDWSKEDQAKDALVYFDANDLNISYQIPNIESILKVTWISSSEFTIEIKN